jgi:hypothetical protein
MSDKTSQFVVASSPRKFSDKLKFVGQQIQSGGTRRCDRPPNSYLGAFASRLIKI